MRWCFPRSHPAIAHGLLEVFVGVENLTFKLKEIAAIERLMA
jgi:hypothetical protein